MFITSTNYTVVDYCENMLRKQIVVNRHYQRSDKVWPPAAKSFLIETILLNFPIPKLSLYQVTDLKSRKTIKEIVDGQQRSQAILDFYSDKLRLSRVSNIPEAAGKLYSQLDDDLKQLFLDYSLSVDLFVSAAPDEIREVFRRINSYTVPLNHEERRHSTFQGIFKWFIYKLSKRFDQNLLDLGVFGEKQLTRMADSKLYSEIIHAVFYGITQTSAKAIDDLYRKFEPDFPQGTDIEKRFEEAINTLLDLEDIHKGLLMKPFNVYALILAIFHVTNPVEKLVSVYELNEPYNYDRELVVANLSSLAENLESPEDYEDKFKEFVLANLVKTNAALQRKARFKWFCKALEPSLL